MGDTGEDGTRSELPDETEKPERAMTDAAGAQLMDGNSGRKAVRLGIARAGEKEMNVVLFRIEMASESLDDMFGSATAQMRNEQTDSWTFP